MFGNGLVIALVRLQEPYYIFAIKQEIYENFGYVLDEPEESLENQPLHAFYCAVFKSRVDQHHSLGDY
jgi:hypothetical protein